MDIAKRRLDHGMLSAFYEYVDLRCIWSIDRREWNLRDGILMYTYWNNPSVLLEGWSITLSACPLARGPSAHLAGGNEAISGYL